MALSRLQARLRAVHPELPTYLLAIALMSVCSGIFENTYNNYLYGQFRIPATTRGNLEFVREFPGLINAPLMGALSSLPETHVAGLAAWVTALGMAGLGILGQNWWIMLLCTIFWGIGSHLIMPLRSSMTMSLGGETKRGRRLGQVGAVGIVGSILGAGIVWLVFQSFGRGQRAEGMMRPVDEWQYDLTFYLAAAACAGAGVAFHLLRKVGSRTRRPTFVIKRKYWLYYVLNVLFGARKQVFLTFGRWVLVTVFNQQPATFAKLSILGSLLGIPFNTMLGRMLDRFGERAVITANSLALLLVCVGYGSAKHLGLSDFWALMLVYATYLTDQVVFAMEMARDTYMAKIAETPDDLTASLSVGISINHIVAMSVPSLGGMLWAAYGYETVFMAAAGVAVLMAVFSSRVRVPGAAELAEVRA